MTLRKRSSFYLVLAIAAWTVALNIPTASGTPSETKVARFVNQLTASSANPEIQQEILKQTEESKGLLTGFLQDLIQVMAGFESQNFSAPTTEPAQKFIEKWTGIQEACTDCIAFTPAFEKILTEVNKTSFKTPRHNNPLGPVYEFFVKMERKNWGGLGPLFKVIPFPRKHLTTVIFENKIVRVTPEGRNEFITERSMLQALNGQVKFIEHIRYDKVRSVYLAFNEMTVLHDGLEQLKEDGADPDVISIWQNYIDLLHQELLLAKEQGTLDEDVYLQIIGQTPLTNDVIRKKHPLLHPNYHFEYKVAELYPIKN